MSRGIVMETGPKYVIVLTPDGQFRKVTTSRKLQIGEEFSFTERRRYAGPRKLYSFSIGAAAVMLLLFVPFLLGRIGHGPEVVAYLTMDVNPSIELGVTADEHVLELRAINRDGADVTDGLAYKGLPLEQVTEAIMDRISAGPYLNSGEGDVIITSVMMAEPAKAEYENLVTTHMDAAVRKSLEKTDKGRGLQVEVTTLSAPKEIREEAEHDGLSAGKLAFYLMAKEQGHKVSINQMKTQSIHQTAKPWGGVKAVIDEHNKPAATAEKTDDSKKTDTAAKQQKKKTEPAVDAEKKKEELREQLKALLEKEKEKRAKREDDNKNRINEQKSDGKNNSSSKKNNGNAAGDDKKNGKGWNRNDDRQGSGSPSAPVLGSFPKNNDNRKDESVGKDDDDDNGDWGRGGQDDRGSGDGDRDRDNDYNNDRNKDRDDDHKGGQEEGKTTSDGRHNGVSGGVDKKQSDKSKNDGKMSRTDNDNKNGNDKKNDDRGGPNEGDDRDHRDEDRDRNR